MRRQRSGREKRERSTKKEKRRRRRRKAEMMAQARAAEVRSSRGLMMGPNQRGKEEEEDLDGDDCHRCSCWGRKRWRRREKQQCRKAQSRPSLISFYSSSIVKPKPKVVVRRWVAGKPNPEPDFSLLPPLLNPSLKSTTTTISETQFQPPQPPILFSFSASNRCQIVVCPPNNDDGVGGGRKMVVGRGGEECRGGGARRWLAGKPNPKLDFSILPRLLSPSLKSTTTTVDEP